MSLKNARYPRGVAGEEYQGMLRIPPLYGALALFTLLTTPTTQAVETLQLFAIFGEKAVVVIDGERRMLTVGESSPEGVTLIETRGDSVVVSTEGGEKTLALGNQLLAGDTRKVSNKVTIVQGSDGMYRSRAWINGQPLDVLIDTGASSVALSERHALAINLDYLSHSQPLQVQTASGIANAYALKIDRIKLGAIELRDVSAVVISGSYPTEVLLGMTFLERLKVVHNGRFLQLERRW